MVRAKETRARMENRYFDYPTDALVSEPAVDEPVELGLLDGADEADWSLLFDYGERRDVSLDEPIIEWSTTGRSLFIVLAGSFRIMAPAGRRARQTVVRTLHAGAVVGEVGFAVGGRRSHSVIANEPAEIFEFEWQSFERLAAAHPALGVRFLTDVLRIVATRTRAGER